MNTKKITLYFFISTILIFLLFTVFLFTFVNIKNKAIKETLEIQRQNSTKLISERVHEDLLFDNLTEARRKLILLKQENIINDFLILKNHHDLNTNLKYCESIFFERNTHSALWGKLCLNFPDEKDESSPIDFKNFTVLFILINTLFLIFFILFFKTIHKYNLDLFEGIENILNSNNQYNIEKSIWYPIFAELKKLVNLNKENEQKLLLKSIENEKIELMLQVAHDIRSPLAALENIDMSKLDNLNEQKIAKRSIYQLKEIANSLLKKGKSAAPSELRPISIVTTINNLIENKSIEFPNRKIILSNFSKNNYVNVEPIALETILSNLINNAIEASNDDSPVSINIENSDNLIQIKITDQGKGIPDDIISKLGNEKITLGKENGNGLGFYHATQAIKNWGGKIEIQSQLNIGTSIIISIPTIIENQSSSRSVLLDNDELIRLTWESKAKKCGINLTCFSKSTDLFSQLDQFPQDTVFYIDSVLDHEKGEDIAKILFNLGYKNLIICSGHSEEKFSHLKFIIKVIGKNPPFC